MKQIKIFLIMVVVLSSTATFAQVNPFAKYGYDVKVLTMTNGKFNEFFDMDTVVQIGDLLFNTNSMKIIGFAEKDSITPMPDASVISRWVSPDPMAEKFYFITPYNYTYNDPVRYFDPDGRIGRDANGNIVYVQTGENQGTLLTHESGAVTMATQVVIFTDKGNPVIAYMNPVDEKFNTNCHGNTFADGQFWINNDQAEIILNDEYSGVSKKKVEQGDVAAYTDITYIENEVVVGEDNFGVPITEKKTDPESELSHTARVKSKGEKRNDITVDNLGGMQITTTPKNYKNGWETKKSNTTTTINFFRKKGEDREYNKNEIQKLQDKYGNQ